MIVRAAGRIGALRTTCGTPPGAASWALLAMAIACSPAFTQNTERATSGDFSLRDFGADPSGIEDSSPAFARLMEAVGDRRQVRITIPLGTYRLASRVVLNAVGNAESYGMRIQGAGEDVTELRVDNPDGGLQFHGTHINRLSFTVSDLSMVAVRENAGVALAFDTANPGDHHSRQFNAENLLIRGERFDRGSFNAGIAVRNAWYPRLDNVKITSVYGPRPAESDPMEFAILLEDCYSPLVRGCYVWGARNGLAYRARDKQPEDGIVRDSYFVGCDTGVTVDLKADTAQWEEPAFHVETCHIAYRDRGVVLHGVRQANISHCLFYCSDRQGAAFHGGGPSRDFDPLDIDLSYASDVIIDGNIFTEPANPRRVAVRIGPDSGYAIIHGNQFNLEGTAVRNESKTASFVTGNVFGGRRDFSQGLRRYVDPIGTLVISDAAP